MHCKYCGHALSNLSAICPNCGMLMSNEQMKMRKEINGYNNPYVQRLNKLNENFKYKEPNNGKNNIMESAIFITIILMIVTIIAVIIFINNR